MCFCLLTLEPYPQGQMCLLTPFYEAFRLISVAHPRKHSDPAGGTAASTGAQRWAYAAALFVDLRSRPILAPRKRWLSTRAGARWGPPRNTKLFPWLTLKLCVGRETWGGSSTTNGEVWSETSGKLLVLLQGNWIEKLAVAKFTQLILVRTEFCFNCQLKLRVPGSLGPREPWGGGRVGAGESPMTGLATGGQDKLAESPCCGQNFPWRKSQHTLLNHRPAWEVETRTP